MFNIWVVPVPGHRAEDAAQAWSDHRVGPTRGTIYVVSCRARAGLFRAVPVPAHRAWPIWPSIRQPKRAHALTRMIPALPFAHAACSPLNMWSLPQPAQFVG
jgi:hypothetical protein